MKITFRLEISALLLVVASLPALGQTNHLTINAATFNYIAGTPDYSNPGMVGGGSSTITDGVANVALPQAVRVAGFTFCGRDDASDQNVGATLWRKTINPINSAFTAPQKMAHVETSVSGASNSMVCLKTTTISVPFINNPIYTYYVELQIGFTTEAISVTIDY